MKKIQLLKQVKIALRQAAHSGQIRNHYGNGGKATSPYFGGKLKWEDASDVLNTFIKNEEERIKASRERRGLE